MVAVRAAHGNLIAHLKAVQVVCKLTALLDAEFLVFFVRRRRGDGEHTLADARCAQHSALAGHMLEELAALRRIDAERLDVRSLLTDVRDDADLRDQNVFYIVIMAMTGITHGLQPPFQTP